MSELSKNILDHIKEEGIKPKPKWVFTGWNILLILSVLITVIMGGVMMGIVMLKFSQLEWNFVPALEDGVMPGFWEVLPLMWVFLLLLVLGVSGKVFESLEGAYKYSHWLVVGGVALLSLVLGGITYASGVADVVENSLRGTMPIYEQMEKQKEQKWNLPEKGLLPGRIMEMELDSFELEDLRDVHWQVDINEDILKKARLREGDMVMVIGKKQGEGVYEAIEVRKKPAFGGVRLKGLINRRLPNRSPRPPKRMLEEQGIDVPLR